MRIKKNPNSKYFYALDRHDTWSVRIVGLVGLASLGFAIAGFLNFLTISPFVFVGFLPILTIVTLYHLIQYGLMAQYPGFDIRKHKRLVAQFKRQKCHPKVAVLIPAAGEDPVIVEDTLKSALAIDYPSFEVFILDDSKDGIYTDLASRYTCNYMRRRNIGHQKKAGNMNHALRHLSNDFEQILVLDADFKARPEMLNELVPYSGEDVGIVQSPQHFPMTADVHRRSKIEYGAAYIQQDFYRITQVARDKFGAAICVGTNALYNVKALKAVGGYEGVGAPRGWGHSEDVHTGLKIINITNSSGQRYRIKYIPIQLAEGYCPDNHHSFYKQQNRWCTGSMQLLFSGKTLFSNSLSLPQKIAYGSNSLYYYYTIALLTSPLYLLVLTLLNGRGAWRYTLLFMPSLITHLIVGPFLLRKKRRPIATSLVVLSNAYTFLQALILLIRRKPLGWEATGARPSGRSTHFTQFKLLVFSIFLLFYVPTLAVIVLDNKLRIGPSMFIVASFLISFVAHLFFLYYVLIGTTNKRRMYADRKFYAAILATALVVLAGGVGYEYQNKYEVSFSRDSVFALNKDGVSSHTVAGIR